MANITDYLRNAYLNQLRNVAGPQLANVYLGLFSTAPTMPAGTGGTELTSGTAPGYARIAVPAASLSAAASGVEQNGTAITMAAATGTWPAAVAWGLWDALTAGNLLWAGTLVGQNDVQTISTSGQLTAGTYTITYPGGGTATVAINFNDTAARIQELLEALPAVGQGNVTVAFSGNRFDQATPGSLVITAVGTLANAAQTLATLTPSGITGGTLSIAHTTSGSTGSKTLGNTDVFSLPINTLNLSIA